jgi:hypothetical protein
VLECVSALPFSLLSILPHAGISGSAPNHFVICSEYETAYLKRSAVFLGVTLQWDFLALWKDADPTFPF